MLIIFADDTKLGGRWTAKSWVDKSGFQSNPDEIQQ